MPRNTRSIGKQVAEIEIKVCHKYLNWKIKSLGSCCFICL